MRIDEIIFRGVLTVAGASLGINSYFVKEKVSEISDDIRSLSISYQQLRVENASRDAVLASIKTRLEVYEIRSQTMEDRLRQLEIKLGRK